MQAVTRAKCSTSSKLRAGLNFIAISIILGLTSCVVKKCISTYSTAVFETVICIKRCPRSAAGGGLCVR